MGDKSGISWTEATWNPLVGCSRVSEGCRNCYAEGEALRQMSHPSQKVRAAYEGTVKSTSSGSRWTGQVNFLPERLGQPLRWSKARRIFVNSMSDLFHEGVDFEVIAAIYGVMLAATQHQFQVLTKRPQRALDFFAWLQAGGAPGDVCTRHAESTLGGPVGTPRGPGPVWPAPNIHLGVSVEDQATADARIPLLLQMPATVRWISAEPLLDALDLQMVRGGEHFDVEGAPYLDALRGTTWWGNGDHGCCIGTSLNWVVVGGESGTNARHCDLNWIRQVVRQCQKASVPVFVKQLGYRAGDYNNGIAGAGVVLPDVAPPLHQRLRDRKGGDPSEWPQDLRIQETLP